MTQPSGSPSVDEPRRLPVGRVAGRSLLTFLGLTGTVAGLTGLYLGMRSVMDVGGACGEGGPYVIAQECPEGVAALMPLSIFGGLIALGVYLAGVRGFPGPHVALLAWPALFLSLGWNFLEYGLDPPAPPGQDPGLEWGWLVCAVVFGLMGGLPLLFAVGSWRPLFWSDGEGEGGAGAGSRLRDGLIGAGSGPATGSVIRPTFLLQGGGSTPTAPTGGPPPVAPSAPAAAFDGDERGESGDGDDLVGRLERLARMHRRGELDAAEYEAAKQAVLEGGR